MIDALFGQGQPPPPGGMFGDPNTMLLWMVGLFFLFYFVVMRPMSKRQQREQQAMFASVKRGTKVLTSAGIIGTVVTVKDNEDELTIRSEDTRLKVLRSSVVKVLGSDESEAVK